MIEHEPDYRFSLANERTFLAWIRTALGLLAGGVAVGQFFVSETGNSLNRVLGVVCTVVASAIALGALRHWQAVQTAMRRDLPLPRSPMIPLVVGGVCVVAGLSVGMAVL
ncbi:YidH family protein [Rhodococcus sp. NPDC056743]|uniref:YidH family protein n=1 Tax=Rhodococcus sp. NPDC056743 TaxID=3345934 RepID=UPI00366E29B2